MHVNLITHGRRICHAQRPACTECTLYSDVRMWEASTHKRLSFQTRQHINSYATSSEVYRESYQLKGFVTVKEICVLLSL